MLRVKIGEPAPWPLHLLRSRRGRESRALSPLINITKPALMVKLEDEKGIAKSGTMIMTTDNEITKTILSNTVTTTINIGIMKTIQNAITMKRDVKTADVRGFAAGKAKGSGVVKGTARGSALSATTGAIMIGALALIADLVVITLLSSIPVTLIRMADIMTAAPEAV